MAAAIREFRDSDWPEVWELLRATFAAGDTYTFAPDSTEAEIRKAWVDLPAATFVARDAGGGLLGTYFIKPNQPGLGNHVCNCGYVVAPRAAGRGVATAMCEHSQSWALDRDAVQFRRGDERAGGAAVAAARVRDRGPASGRFPPPDGGLRRRARDV